MSEESFMLLKKFLKAGEIICRVGIPNFPQNCHLEKKIILYASYGLC